MNKSYKCRKELVPFENCKVVFIDEMFKIENCGSQKNANSGDSHDVANLPIRKHPFLRVCC